MSPQSVVMSIIVGATLIALALGMFIGYVEGQARGFNDCREWVREGK